MEEAEELAWSRWSWCEHAKRQLLRRAEERVSAAGGELAALLAWACEGEVEWVQVLVWR